MQKNKKFLLPIITAISILFSGYIPVMADVDLSTIPAYTGEPYVEINDNVPDFPEDDFTTDSFESYSDLDNLGRCGVAYANIGQDLMPTEKRGSIGQVKPSGWHTQKYDNVDGKFAYNRCHLIGYQLTAVFSIALPKINTQKNLLSGSPCLKTGKKTAGKSFGSRIRSKKRSDYIRRWTDACLILKNACFLLQEKRCACQPMSLIWKTY